MAGGGTRGADGQRWETRQSMFACLRTGLFLPREYPCVYASRDSLLPARGVPLRRELGRAICGHS